MKKMCAGARARAKRIAHLLGANDEDLDGKYITSEIMFEFPNKMVCHADSFSLDRPIAALTVDDNLMHGEMYFVVLLDGFSSHSTAIKMNK